MMMRFQALVITREKMYRSLLRRFGAMTIFALAASGCVAAPIPNPGPVASSAVPATAVAAPSPVVGQPTAAPSPVVAQPTLVPAKPTTAQPGVPTFSFAPQDGGPGTWVALNGWNFAPGKPIVVRLGMPQPV